LSLVDAYPGDSTSGKVDLTAIARIQALRLPANSTLPMFIAAYFGMEMMDR